MLSLGSDWRACVKAEVKISCIAQASGKGRGMNQLQDSGASSSDLTGGEYGIENGWLKQSPY